MLDFLVTSKARRRLLLLLFGEGVSGSASELAKRAGVGFASAYRELQAMRRIELVTLERGRGAAFRANQSHPLTGALSDLVSTPSSRPTPQPGEEATREHLAALGAPVLVRRSRLPRGPLEEELVAGVALAHRDPAVARALPVAFYRQRDRLDPARLVEAAQEQGEKSAVGLFLDLTKAVSGDARFGAWARALRDRRVQTKRPFFYSRSATLLASATPDRSPQVAHRWGYRLDIALDDFQSLFAKAQRAS